jgi:type III restriction enzyme
MPRRKKSTEVEELDLLQARVTTAPCVPALRRAVAEWRDDRYKGASETSRLLLNHWFHIEHRLRNGERFQYHLNQREALETLIYVYEVAKTRRHRDLLERFASNVPGVHVLQKDDFARYCLKMATGSGKTKAMALAIAWQYFNAVAEGRDDFARTFLVIAPNVIVFERLRTDFEGGRIFRSDPVVPPELDVFWDFDCYVRGEPERAGSQGALYLTNVQQLYERVAGPDGSEPEAIAAVLGPKPPAEGSQQDDFAGRIDARRTPVAVLNDEGHHTHDEENEWNRVIRQVHERAPGGLVCELDYSATPRYEKGGLFTWTIYDYPLKQAIIDNIVKRPMKGVTTGMGEGLPSDVASTKYRAYLTAGVERWREYRELLKGLGKKPILFVMMSSTAEAEDVGEYLRVKYPDEFADDKLLIIHTDKTGEISKRDLDAARKTAREVDEGTSPVNAIVSVLMLREGWDVQNVTVIVGLRPYTSKANILPEQTIGRGLRLMFGGLTNYVERVDIIGNGAFLKFVEQLEHDEEIALDTFDLKEPLVIKTIEPDLGKVGRDIEIPVLSPILTRKKTLAEEIASLDVMAFSCPVLPKKENDKAAQRFRYEGKDIITLEKIIEREYTIPEPQTAEEVISYYAKRISADVKLPSQFAALVPKVREFLEQKAFGETVKLSTPEMIKAISTPVAQYLTVKTFAAALRGLVVEELKPTLEGAGRKLSETEPFPFSRSTFAAEKTIFNLVAPGNEFERDFAMFLERAVDIAAFAKLPPTSRLPFSIEYTDNMTNLRYYEPDFVARQDDGTHWLIETKGREDVDVAHKDRAARIWCDNATLLTGIAWRYVKIPQPEYQKLQPSDFNDLAVAFGS